MKIAFIVGSFPVLSETFILGQAIGLLERGHDVRVFAWRRPGSALVYKDVHRYGLIGRTRYLDRPFKYGGPGASAAAVARTNFRAPLMALKWLKKLRQGAVSLEQLNLALPFLSGEFDIIHCHFGSTGHLGIFLKDMGVRAPVVTSFYGYDLSLLIASKGKDIYKELFLKGDLFLPLSEYFKGRLIEIGCPEDKITVLRMGVDTRRFAYAERRLCPGEAVRVVTVGRLVEKKGYEYTLRAIAALCAKGRRIVYSIGGEGPLRQDLESLTRTLGINRHVTFLGAVGQDEVLEMYRQGHIFVLPSITATNGDQEGTPVSIMEAQATGMAVLSTYHSGIPELVADGKSGYLVAERDPDALAERLAYLIDHPEVWPGMGMAGRRIVEEEYNRDTLIERLLEMYRDLIAKKM